MPLKHHQKALWGSTAYTQYCCNSREKQSSPNHPPLHFKHTNGLLAVAAAYDERRCYLTFKPISTILHELECTLIPNIMQKHCCKQLSFREFALLRKRGCSSLLYNAIHFFYSTKLHLLFLAFHAMFDVVDISIATSWFSRKNRHMRKRLRNSSAAMAQKWVAAKALKCALLPILRYFKEAI